MPALEKMGVMCINKEIQGVCQNCLWLEWNPQLKRCNNYNTCVCRLGQRAVSYNYEPLQPLFLALKDPYL
ncbi:MAG TPA: hypothetical protein DCY27_09395 [Desulfobacterales bacterium]|nr:hypothetical protein [Desulfobacterales bacterium]